MRALLTIFLLFEILLQVSEAKYKGIATRRSGQYYSKGAYGRTRGNYDRGYGYREYSPHRGYYEYPHYPNNAAYYNPYSSYSPVYPEYNPYLGYSPVYYGYDIQHPAYNVPYARYNYPSYVEYKSPIYSFEYPYY